MDIMIAALRDFETTGGDLIKAGTVMSVGKTLGEQWLSDGRCCLYSEYNPSMVDVPSERKGRQARVLRNPKPVSGEQSENDSE